MDGFIAIFRLFDGRTLFLSGALITGVFALVMFSSIVARKSSPGFCLWAWAECGFTGSYLLQALDGFLPDILVVFLGDLLVYLAMILMGLGMFRFLERPSRAFWFSLGAAALFVCEQYFFWVHDDLRLRTIFLCAFLLCAKGYISWPLWPAPPAGRGLGYRFCLSVLALSVLGNLLHIVSLSNDLELRTKYTGDPIDTFFYLLNLLFMIGLAFSFFLLVNERNFAVVQAANNALTHEVETRTRAETALRAQVAERKELEGLLRKLSRTDELTHVFNRRGLLEALEREAMRATRHQHELSVLVLDLDNLKKINDSYGHTAGDKALIAFTEACLKNLRISDSIGRSGGDEFAILLPETGLSDALFTAEKLCATVAATSAPCSGCGERLSVSIGVASWSRSDEKGLETLACADRALYQAKHGGKNRVAAATPMASLERQPQGEKQNLPN